MTDASQVVLLDNQLSFLIEIDRLKSVERRTMLIGRDRYENSAEHSWHVALCANVLAPYAAGAIDISRVTLMLLVHDIVEIDAGDTFAYDEAGKLNQHQREELASARLFGLLPDEQATEYAALFSEFDEHTTDDSRFANGVDRLMPLLHNYYTDGQAWRKHGVAHSQVLERMAIIRDGAPALWPYVTGLLEDAVAKGFLQPG